VARWIGDRAVEIIAPGAAKVFKREQRVGEIKIVYEKASGE
jgi:hypothetical protein